MSLFIDIYCFVLVTVHFQLVLTMPSDKSRDKGFNGSNPRPTKGHDGHSRRNRDRSRSRSVHRSDSDSRRKHSTPEFSHRSLLRNPSPPIAVKGRSSRNVEGHSSVDHRHSRDRESKRNHAKDSLSPVADEMYDSFVGGIVPKDQFTYRAPVGEGKAIPVHVSSSSGAARSESRVDVPISSGLGAPRTHIPPAQVPAPPSGQQAFSDVQLRQIHSLFDSWKESSSGENCWFFFFVAHSTSHTIVLQFIFYSFFRPTILLGIWTHSLCGTEEEGNSKFCREYEFLPLPSHTVPPSSPFLLPLMAALFFCYFCFKLIVCIVSCTDFLHFLFFSCQPSFAALSPAMPVPDDVIMPAPHLFAHRCMIE